MKLKKCDNCDIIRGISQKLAENLVSISIDNEQLDFAKGKILYSANTSNLLKERFIVVIGAGTSFNANQNVLLGKDASIALMKLFRGVKGKMIKKEIKKLSQVYRLNKDDFETILLAISKYSDNLYEELRNIYNYRYYPDKFYELLAHLFKNRFIDAIINFNFDEMLDQAIDDELGHGAFRKVLFDGDLPRFEELVKDEHFQIPLYIKPHGTVSHKTSLKFTREDYFNISSDINRFLGKLLSGKISNNDKDNIPVNLFVFGFNLESFEFNNLLLENLPKKSQIYVFNERNVEGAYAKEIENRLLKKKKVTTHYVPRDEGDYSTDNVLVKIYDQIKIYFKEEEYQPRGINRHLLISALFSDKKEERKIDEETEIRDFEYFKDRVFVELVLLIAKSKGFVSLQQMTNDRVGIYFNLYKKFGEKANINQILTLFDFCKVLRLNEYSYSREFYTLLTTNNTDVGKITYGKDDVDEIINTLLQQLSNAVSTKLQNKISNYNRLVKDTLIELFLAEDSEICQKDKNLHDNIFRNPVELNTMLRLDYETKLMFNNNTRWGLLLSIAETGEWLENKSDDDIGMRKISLIVADSTHDNGLEKRFGNRIKIHQLKWWKHNQHMSIFIRLDPDNPDKLPTEKDIEKVIYFTRRSRDPLINPVLLTEKDDKKLAFDTFFAYLYKSDYKPHHQVDDTMITSEIIDKIREEYLTELIQASATK